MYDKLGKKKVLEPIICPHCNGHGCKKHGDYNDKIMCKECKGNGIKWG
jgi:DnaJ-class molecular chaperone